MSCVSGLQRGLVLPVLLIASLVIASLGLGGLDARADSLLAYSVDYEMDKARVEKTVDHYGEPIRDVIEQAVENNENNPNSKETAENSYQRESALNEVLPERNSLGEKFSKEDFSGMRKTSDPGEGFRE